MLEVPYDTVFVTAPTLPKMQAIMNWLIAYNCIFVVNPRTRQIAMSQSAYNAIVGVI